MYLSNNLICANNVNRYQSQTKLQTCKSVTACSHRQHEQDKTVLSCPCRQCEHNCRQDKIVWSCFDPVSNFQVFSNLQHIWDWTVANWKPSCLVCNCVHTADMDKTRQFCLVLSVVWTSYKELHSYTYKVDNCDWQIQLSSSGSTDDTHGDKSIN